MQQIPKTIEETKTNKQNFQTHVHFGRHGSESCVLCLFVVWFPRWCLIVFALTSLVVVVSLVSPMVFDISKCTFDSSKRLGRGCAPSLNKAFTLHEFQCIRGFLVWLISLCKWFPLIFTRGPPCMHYFIVWGISLYKVFLFTKDFLGLSFLRHFTSQAFPHVRGFLV